MSKPNAYGEKLMQVINQGSLSESAVREIENNALLHKASTFLSSIQTLINGYGSILLAEDVDVEYYYEVTGADLKEAIDNASEEVRIKYLNPQGIPEIESTLGVDIVVDHLSNEIEVANLTNNVLAVITSIVENSDYPTITNGLRSACANATTAAGSAFSEFINRAILSTSSPFELRKLIVQSVFPEPDYEGFQIPTIGQVTGTTGIALWFHAGFQAVSGALSSLKMDFLGTINRAYNKYVEVEMANAAAMAVGWRVLSYQFSKLFNDPLVLPVKNYTHLGLNNTYIDLGIAPTTLVEAMLLHVETNDAVAIPTVGATWYIYRDSDRESRDWHIGMQKHLYDYDAAHKLYVLASQQSNTLEDVFKCFATNGYSLEIKDTGGIFSSITQFNEYVYSSFRETEKLITLGLLMLQSDDSIIMNRYYQDVDSDVRNNAIYRWNNMFNGSSILADPNANTRLGLALAASNNSSQDSSIINFVSLMLTNYFDNLNENIGLCQHLFVNTTLPGYMNVADDALVKDQITTRVNGILITAAVFSSLIISASAIRSLRSIALESQISAQRLVFDSSTPVSTAKQAIIKANRLSKLVGASTSFTTGIASIGLSEAGVSFDSRNNIEQSITVIRKLINGES